MLTRKALAKFELLDVDETGWLGGDALLQLADWVAHEIRPGQQITASARLQQATEILRFCDTRENGSVNARDFAAYYDRTASAFLKNPPPTTNPRAKARLSAKDTDEAVLSVLSSRARNTFSQLSKDGRSLAGDEVMELAEWVVSSFRPGIKVTAQQRLQEASKIVNYCDHNDSGRIILEDFVSYYDQTAMDMLKTSSPIDPTPPMTDAWHEVISAPGFLPPSSSLPFLGSLPC